MQQADVAVNSAINRQFAHEGAVYASADYEASTRWFFNFGLRYSAFDQVGPYKQPLFDELGAPTGEYQEYKRGTTIKLWHGAEPRFSFRYSINSTINPFSHLPLITLPSNFISMPRPSFFPSKNSP